MGQSVCATGLRAGEENRRRAPAKKKGDAAWKAGTPGGAMRNGKKMALFALALLLAALVLWGVLGGRTAFRGDRTADGTRYVLAIRSMNGTDRHTLDLEAGDTISVQFRTRAGTLHLEILGPDGTALYTGNGREATAFTIPVRQSGTYTVVVEGRRARGDLSVIAAK